MSNVWRCPECQSVLAKRKDAAMAVFKAGGQLLGTVTCGKCDAKYSLHDIYAGKYDIEEDFPET